MNDFAKLESILSAFAIEHMSEMNPKLRTEVVAQMFGPIGVGLSLDHVALTMNSLQAFLAKLRTHKLDVEKLKNRKGFFYDHIIDPDILYDPWFAYVQYPFYTLKPGNSQAGPLEFILCFLFDNVEYVQKADSGGDILVDGKVRVEIKSHGSKVTINHEKIAYYSTGGCDILLVAKKSTNTQPLVMVGLDFTTSSEWEDVLTLDKINAKETRLAIKFDHGKLCKEYGLKYAPYLTRVKEIV